MDFFLPRSLLNLEVQAFLMHKYATSLELLVKIVVPLHWHYPCTIIFWQTYTNSIKSAKTRRNKWRNFVILIIFRQLVSFLPLCTITLTRLSAPLPEKVWDRRSEEIYIMSRTNDQNYPASNIQ